MIMQKGLQFIKKIAPDGKIFYKSRTKEQPPFPKVQDVYESEANDIYKDEISNMIKQITEELIDYGKKQDR